MHTVALFGYIYVTWILGMKIHNSTSGVLIKEIWYLNISFTATYLPYGGLGYNSRGYYAGQIRISTPSAPILK